MGPVSVLPDFQKKSIGGRLILEGIDILKKRGAEGVLLEGDPAYYNRFGFQHFPELIYEHALAPEYFMALPLSDPTPPTGKATFHSAFGSE